MPKGLFGEGLLDGVYLKSKLERLWGSHTQLEHRMDRLNEEIQAKAKEKVKKKRKLRGDRGSTEPHKLGQPGSSPGPASKPKEVGHAKVNRRAGKHGRRKKGEGSGVKQDQPLETRGSPAGASDSGEPIDAESGQADAGGELHPGPGEEKIVQQHGDPICTLPNCPICKRVLY